MIIDTYVMRSIVLSLPPPPPSSCFLHIQSHSPTTFSGTTHLAVRSYCWCSGKNCIQGGTPTWYFCRTLAKSSQDYHIILITYHQNTTRSFTTSFIIYISYVHITYYTSRIIKNDSNQKIQIHQTKLLMFRYRKERSHAFINKWYLKPTNHQLFLHLLLCWTQHTLKYYFTLGPNPNPSNESAIRFYKKKLFSAESHQKYSRGPNA